MSRFKRLCYSLLAALVALQVNSSANAAIIGPYGPYGVDANTTHLYHINESSLNVADSIAGANNRPMTSLGSVGTAANNLGGASYPGFGTGYKGPSTFNAVNVGLSALVPGTVSGNAAADGDDVPMTSFYGADGSFSYECITRIDFDPAATANANSISLITAENETGSGTGQRLFSYSLNKDAGNWYAAFYGFDVAQAQMLQVNSANVSLQQGHWYHAAVTYNGVANTANNLKFYLTDMGTDAIPNGSATVASLLGFAAPVASISDDKLAADLGLLNADFVIGAQGRRSGTSGLRGSYQGIIDEVRISTVERSAGDFIFSAVPEPSTYMLAGFALLTMVCVQSRRHNKCR